MTRPVNILPASLAPRGLSRVQSAAYVGTGVTKFDEMVSDGRMPKPKQHMGPAGARRSLCGLAV